MSTGQSNALLKMATVMAWNTVLMDIRGTSSTPSFKNTLKEFYFSKLYDITRQYAFGFYFVIEFIHYCAGQLLLYAFCGSC